MNKYILVKVFRSSLICLLGGVLLVVSWFLFFFGCILPLQVGFQKFFTLVFFPFCFFFKFGLLVEFHSFLVYLVVIQIFEPIFLGLFCISCLLQGFCIQVIQLFFCGRIRIFSNQILSIFCDFFGYRILGGYIILGMQVCFASFLSTLNSVFVGQPAVSYV